MQEAVRNFGDLNRAAAIVLTFFVHNIYHTSTLVPGRRTIPVSLLLGQAESRPYSEPDCPCFLWGSHCGLRGMMTAAMMYARIPLPPKAQNSTQASRTNVGSMPKYSAIPPQTPSIILCWLDLYSLRSIIIFPFF